MSRRRGRAVALAAAATLVLAAGCGRDDFDNDPRPPTQLEVNAAIDERNLKIDPDDFGAGLAVFTVANLTDREVLFTLDGPTVAESAIQPRGNAQFQIQMETGAYRASVDVDDVDSVLINVGTERESAQDELLLP